ncbi:SDR family NAD(P)-dependent oxidoreductase [Pelolinea submarina]|uniref:3-oxoacyl-[acyl-carrier protein] reductase n=1 Tax=Pelolinea submarina TaxID=913107 RepID=A0A347ZVE3_9CHLR|nr:SDR family oxidoreductase [Pelolinea submarina]REG06971.1 3-oxoacyl-[acyl-carrier protein] reductase [Pelolinea submarina]BBB49274.1 3-oxoacyl-[acyl-carrier protein] reductase [Pelolinea submarina]
MSYEINLSGQVAIITGAAKGIGKAAAEILTQAGAQVVIDDIIDPENAKPIQDEIGKLGLRPHYIQKDISKEENCRDLAAEVLDKFSRIDILVNNAGVVANWEKSFDIHVKAVHFCAEAVKDHMAKRGNGRIINVTSTCVFSGGTGIPQYVATKAGAYSLTRYQAKTYAPLGILVNAVMPSVIMSEMIMTRYESIEEMEAHYIPLMPVGRIGYPEDVAKVILFLCSELSSFVCGEIIVADGGRLAVG